MVSPARDFAPAGYSLVAPDVVPVAAAPLFEARRTTQAVTTLRLRDVVLDPATGLVFRDGEVVAHTRYVVSDAELAAAARRIRNPSSRIAQRRVFCAVNRVSQNYFHWLIQVLPAIESYRHEEGFEAGVLLVPPLQPVWSASLSLLSDRLSELRVPTAPVLIDDLTTSSLLYATPGPCPFSQEVFAGMAARAASAAPPGGSRFYVWRVDTPARPMRNEADLVELLSEHGIEPVVLSLLTLEEQIRLFQQAELVVGPHGAGLANLVFCRRGARVLELLPEHYVNPVFNVLAQQSGLEYWFDIHPAEASPGLWRHQTPWTVELERFERRLGALLASMP